MSAKKKRLSQTPDTAATIFLGGVRVNNLKDLDVEVPRNKLVVVTGVSGAGKSSLVIDTICAEGQRVYLESLNPYSRQFVGKMSNPDVDFAIGIPPTISVKKAANSQRWSSTVGTVTEIYNYLRLVFAKIGVAECDRCGRKMKSVTPGRIADELEKGYHDKLALITFRASGSGAVSVIERLVREGFTRAMIDGAVVRLEDIGDSTKALQSELYVVVDRLASGQRTRKRLVDSLEIAYREGDGELQVHVSGGQILRYSARADCPYCGTEPVNLSPALFSFNSAAGWCPRCNGSGKVAEVDLEAVVPDDRKSIEHGAIAPWQHPQYRWPLNELRVIAHKYGLSLHTAHRRLSRKHKKLILEGETYFPGVYRFFDMLERKKHKPGVTEFLDMYRKNVQCRDCGGGRLNRQALSVKVDGYNIAGLCAEPLSGLRKRLAGLALDSRERTIAGGALDQAARRVDCLIEMRLGYLTLDRSFSTLSEGEIQRINLAGFLAADLAGSLYALDEPTVGLHPWDRTRLLSALQALKDRGNTVVVIEHDPNMLARADQIIELGPGAGQDGGEVVFQGSYDQMVACKRSRTGSHLSGRVTMPPRGPRSATGYLRIVKANKYNLRNVDVRIPLGMLVCITGVSGSGKTVLLRDVLFAALDGGADMLPPERRGYVAVEGGNLFEQVIFAEHGSMSRSPRPIVASYVGFYASIRALLSDVPLARFRGYRSNHFSFNAKVGRCPGCNGLGHVEVGMSLVPDVRTVCPACEGKRFKEEVLEVRLGGKNIADVLSISVDEAMEFFQDSPRIVPGLRVLKDAGLGYVQLGQPLATLSRGETQRLKLAACMVKGAGGSTLFLFDEPTAGLHFDDVKDLIECFNNLIGRGASVVVAEHNLELVRCADYVIDLGPGAGRRGGRVVARGTPEHIARCKSSKTGAALEVYRNGAVRPPGAGARSPKGVRT